MLNKKSTFALCLFVGEGSVFSPANQVTSKNFILRYQSSYELCVNICFCSTSYSAPISLMGKMPEQKCLE